MSREWRACSQTDVVPCIRYAARKYGQPLGVAERVAMCESTDNPYADNGRGDLGLWQFLPATFNVSPYRDHSYWSARWSSLAAMWWWAKGSVGTSQWQCF